MLEKTSFCIKKMIRYRNEDNAWIPKPPGKGDEIQFLIPIEYEYGNI